jgi:hypothetical protein
MFDEAKYESALQAKFPVGTLVRANYLGAVIGMLAGLGVCMYYMVMTYPFFGGVPANQWFNIAPIAAGIFGMPVGFLGIIIGSLISKAPSTEIQQLVDHVRYPNLAGDIDYIFPLIMVLGKLYFFSLKLLQAQFYRAAEYIDLIAFVIKVIFFFYFKTQEG